MRAIRRFTIRTVLPPQLQALDELAHNLRWSWHNPTRDLFASIDATVWQQVHRDPVALLGALDPGTLRVLAGDADFVDRVHVAADDLRRYLDEPRWYQYSAEPTATIAYFSAEFGITSVLPQYSGGLGILAGDHLKSASDLGVPIIGVGLLYQSGYFAQELTRDGWQVESYPVLDPDNMPLTLLRGADGTPILIQVALPGGRTLHAQIWRADVGRVPLLLLDSNVPGNDDAARKVTDRLYGGSGEDRLQQELLLGIGGVRALRAYAHLTGGTAPEVFHCNEGHAGFLAVERIRELMHGGDLSFAEALEAVRAGTVFTTHTPVPAGIDRFPMAYIDSYFGPDAWEGVPTALIASLGAETFDGGDPTVFNMAVMGLRVGQHANGVSKLHGAVSRAMFHGLWPGFDDRDVPIASVTNGVHSPTWVHRELHEAAQTHLSMDEIDSGVGWLRRDGLTDAELWNARRVMRTNLVEDARARLRASWLARGASPAELGWVDDALDPEILTIGFARRVPTYKRLTLMLRDPERLTTLLLDPQRPVQLIVAGKSHPADEQGKQLIQQLVKFADDPKVRHRIVFLPNYDIAMAKVLVPGCDVWLNNPLRPLEACGTSGMKAALNGGLNLSILDGWWDEWFDGENGWAIPTADGVEDPDRRDDLEAAGLYDLIVNQVAPRFYTRDEHGIPTRWLAMVRHTLATLGPKVQATRMVREYIERLYAPAFRSVRTMTADHYAGARTFAQWKEAVRRAWPGVRVDHVETGGVGDSPQIGDVLQVRSYVSLDTLSPTDVDVQVVYGKVSDSDELDPYWTQSLTHVATYEDGRHQYAGEVELARSGAFGYAVRIVPSSRFQSTTAEMGLVATADGH